MKLTRLKAKFEFVFVLEPSKSSSWTELTESSESMRETEGKGAWRQIPSHQSFGCPRSHSYTAQHSGSGSPEKRHRRPRSLCSLESNIHSGWLVQRTFRLILAVSIRCNIYLFPVTFLATIVSHAAWALLTQARCPLSCYFHTLTISLPCVR